MEKREVNSTGIDKGLKQPDALFVRVEYDGDNYDLRTYPNEYRSLMQVIYDKVNPEGFGECLGMGKCGTCLIAVLKSVRPLTYYERNGETTLQKLTPAGENIKLACQVMADENINGLHIKILT